MAFLMADVVLYCYQAICIYIGLPTKHAKSSLSIQRYILGQFRRIDDFSINLPRNTILDVQVSNFKQVFGRIVMHDTFGVKEIGDDGIGDAQLTIRFR